MRVAMVMFVVLSILAPSLFGGLSFVWCAPMERVMLRPCCPQAEHAPSHDAVISQPCCENERVAVMPGAVLHSMSIPYLAAPPLVILLTIAWLYTLCRAVTSTHGRRGRPEARAGPETPLFLLNRCLLN
jgi:hypothetical protein